MQFNPEKMVAEFIDKFDAPTDPNFWRGLMVEEGKELREAYENLLKEAADFMYVYAGFMITAEEEDKTRTADPETIEAGAFLEGVVRLLGGEVFSEAFRRVHDSNLSKLGDDGLPIKREDGKILKGPNYKPPYLSDLI